MKLKTFKTVLLCCSIGLISFSCDKEEDLAGTSVDATLKGQKTSELRMKKGLAKIAAAALSKDQLDCSYNGMRSKLAAAIASHAVEPSECGPTAFDEAITPYVLAFTEDDWNWYAELAAINQLYSAYLDESEQYFGADGHLTNYAAKQERNLVSFWDMPDEVTVRGQHTSTLLDRDAIAAVYINFAGFTEAQAYAQADYIIKNVIGPSEAFDDTPLLSFDGFATSFDLIVIGDGIVQVLTEAGVEEKVTYAGILSHEWAHQIQFNYFSEWYPDLEQGTAEATRLTELEADFFTGYYLTHKRGGTYNWKRVAEFFELFYNIGDCSFESSGHHGTPNQRLAAARLGSILAEETFPKGHILEPEHVHELFLLAYEDIIENSISSKEALASLGNEQLKGIYKAILKHENELKQILKRK